MEMVDKLNNKKEKLNKIGERHENKIGEYHQSVHTWIMNSKGEFLMQKRSANKRMFPNMWSQTGGGVEVGETSLEGALRECKEELGIDIPKEKIEFILSFKRNFVDVWLVKCDFDISKLVLQEEEVAEVKWMRIEEIKKLMEENKLAPSIDIYFNMFIDLLDYKY